MHKKITDRNGFRAVKALDKAAADPRIEEIEGAGMDDGRVFIHLAPGFKFGNGYDTTCHSVGTAAEIKWALSLIEPANPDHGAPT